MLNVNPGKVQSEDMSEASLQAVYISQIAEATLRLLAAKRFLGAFQSTREVPELESAVLQIRKALETIAFAAIAPDKKQYAAFRETATQSPDFTKDYHARRIFAALAKINEDFYPIAVLPATRQLDGSSHYDRKASGYLSKKKFEAAYDRTGKHLHAHNPWSGSKNLQNLAGDLPTIIEETHALLDLHVRFIRTPEFHGVWVIETNRLGHPPRLITAAATGAFVVAAG
jgi:hypothetical protein